MDRGTLVAGLWIGSPSASADLRVARPGTGSNAHELECLAPAADQVLDEPLRGSTAGLFETGIEVRLEMATREDLQALGLECSSVRLEGQVSRRQVVLCRDNHQQRRWSHPL